MLSWSPINISTTGQPIEISHYVIYRSSDYQPFTPSSFDSIAIVLSTNSTFMDFTITDSSREFYRVTAVIDE
jgi:hypothetical protein